MIKENHQKLNERRDQLAQTAAALLATPESERPQKPSALKAWLHDIESMQSLVEQIDKLIERASPQPRVGVPDLVPASNADAGEGVTVARVRKGKRAEIRVTVKPWQGRNVVDVRLWSLFDGQGEEMKPSRKGIAFDAGKLSDVIDALIQAKQHV
jgi:hypothetical protein